MTGPDNWFLFPGGDNAPGDCPWIWLIPDIGESFHKVFFADCCKEFCCGFSPGGIHPHVQRSITPVGKSPFGIIDLVTGHTEVRQKPIATIHSRLCKGKFDPGEIPLENPEWVPGCS